MRKFSYMNANFVAAAVPAAAAVAGAGFWGKAAPIMEAVGLATLPAQLLPMFVENRDTKALKAIRAEDKRRLASGLLPLPMTNTIAKNISQLPPVK